MNVQFQDSFFKSLKKLKWHRNPIYRVYDCFSDKLPNFFKNIWKFRRELWDHRWWDYRFTLEMFKKSIEIQEEGMRLKGWEEQSSKSLKLQKMTRAIEIINTILDEGWIERAEAIHGKMVDKPWKFEETENGSYVLVDEETEEEKKHNKLIFETAHKLHREEWDELWEIIKGKEYKDYKNYDGSDLRGWWD
jgi:hypothetical protein